MMNDQQIKTPQWYSALTLTERISALQTVDGERSEVPVNRDTAERRLERWKSEAPFATGAHFIQRLALDGLTERDFSDLLGKSLESIRDCCSSPPSWLQELAVAFTKPVPPSLSDRLEALAGTVQAGFLSVIEPLINQSCERLHQGLVTIASGTADLPFDLATIEDLLLANLPKQLIKILSRTLVLELNVARLQGLLVGETPEDRFRSFSQRLRQPESALALLQEYSVLARALMTCMDDWVAFSLEFIRHLSADWQEIRTTFTPDKDPGALVKIEGGAGDTHRGGRAVLIATFASGFKSVYKPRSLSVDLHIQQLLTWVNDHGDHPPFRTLKIIDRSTYGWMEYVSAQPCASPIELERFYFRQGGYLALLYSLEATDFHSENLVAAGEHPVLLDLEAFFHPRIAAFDSKRADELAGSALGYSVLRVGLLPQRIWSTGESEGIDISGLGGAPGQLLPFTVPQWDNTGTDEMRMTRSRMTTLGNRNRPFIEGKEVNALDYREALTAGFTSIYRLLLQYREELLSNDGPLAHFTEDEVRVILRPTQTYGTLLFESYHPDVLRDALDRDRLFDRLWLSVEHLPYLAKVIRAECENLRQGDIPMFTTRANSRDIWSSADQRMADFFDKSGLSQVHHRVGQLSEDDLTQQLWFIEASLTSLSMGEDQSRWPTRGIIESQTPATRDRLLSSARAAGDRLEALALRSEHDTSWIGVTFTGNRHWSLAPLGPSLYDGISGVALFLAYLGDVTGEERYTAMAQNALKTVRKQIEHGRSLIPSIGGFSGWGGLIYAFTHLGALWHREDLLREAEAMTDTLPALIERDTHFDVIGGAAGCIAGLTALYRCCPSQRTLAAAMQCGDHLVAKAESMETGIAWRPPVLGETPLTGFSHGAAGVAWALLELAAISDHERYRAAARGAIAYERTLFSPEVENWPDLRAPETSARAENNGQAQFSTAWCHGAPGIGLARLRSLPYLDDQETRAEINVALKTTLAHGFGGNHCLCHGDLGNLELLFQASQALDDARWSGEVDRIAAILIESIHRDGWLCGIPSRIETPGLMTGLAGIGYEMLRLAEPARVPSVLMLEPPPASIAA